MKHTAVLPAEDHMAKLNICEIPGLTRNAIGAGIIESIVQLTFASC